jgi:predicted transcriptional regulator of viral defense system
MDFKELLQIVGSEPLFESSLLLTGMDDPFIVQRQLTRWKRAGKIIQLRRGLYTLAPPYQQVKPHPFLVANHLQSGSYVSNQSALAYFGLIPEYTPVVTSVTTMRPGERETPLGVYIFQHIQKSLFYGYRLVDLRNGMQAFLALPEKALLDLIYLQPGGDSHAYLDELRLQNLERLDIQVLKQLAERASRPKLLRAAERLEELAKLDIAEYENL